MSSDHEDAAFERYQTLRKVAETEARESLMDWAMSDAPDGLTVAQVKYLSDRIVKVINHHTRQVFDSMRGTY